MIYIRILIQRIIYLKASLIRASVEDGNGIGNWKWSSKTEMIIFRAELVDESIKAWQE